VIARLPCDWQPEPSQWDPDPEKHHPASRVVTYEDGSTARVCMTCADDYARWEWEEFLDRESEVNGYAYDGPYFADTMSGGCIEL